LNQRLHLLNRVLWSAPECSCGLSVLVGVGKRPQLDFQERLGAFQRPSSANSVGWVGLVGGSRHVRTGNGDFHLCKSDFCTCQIHSCVGHANIRSQVVGRTRLGGKLSKAIFSGSHPFLGHGLFVLDLNRVWV
jgi:hypothetical protein